MRWNREEYLDMMTFEREGRVMFSELFGPLAGLEDEWRAQGASEDMINMTAFAFDYVPYRGIGGTGAIGLPPEQVIEDTPEKRLYIDGYGRRMRLIKSTATIALPETFPVRTMDDWQKLKPHFLYSGSRVNEDALRQLKRLQDEGTMIVAGIPGGFDLIRYLMGEVEGCVAYYDDPELIRDILGTVRDTSLRVFERVCEIVVPDQLSVHEDMAGKSGPLIGPSTVHEFIYPYYRAVWDFLSSKGTRLFNQDSDGDMTAVLDEFVRCGVNVFHPCEPTGRMDSVAIRERYGKTVAFLGGIDKHVLRKSKAEIMAEVDYRLQPKMLLGGAVMGLDHRIPNGTPFDNYLFYIRYARQKLGLPPFEEAEKGWGRMAF